MIGEDAVAEGRDILILLLVEPVLETSAKIYILLYLYFLMIK